MHKNRYPKLNTEAWQKARMRALVRDDFRCQAHQIDLTQTPCCETRLRNLHVHHLKMRIHGGNHHITNLLTLCRTHHELLHPWMKFRKFRKKRGFAYLLREL